MAMASWRDRVPARAMRSMEKQCGTLVRTRAQRLGMHGKRTGTEGISLARQLRSTSVKQRRRGEG
jgi:hypothetical protein